MIRQYEYRLVSGFTVASWAKHTMKSEGLSKRAILQKRDRGIGLTRLEQAVLDDNQLELAFHHLLNTGWEIQSIATSPHEGAVLPDCLLRKRFSPGPDVKASLVGPPV